MTPILAIVALVHLWPGVLPGPRGGKISRDESLAPSATGKRLFYCATCGVHFDEKDNSLAPHEHSRWQDTQSILDDDQAPLTPPQSPNWYSDIGRVSMTDKFEKPVAAVHHGLQVSLEFPLIARRVIPGLQGP